MDTQATIDGLTKSGLIIQHVDGHGYNVISRSTGAVMQRLISAVELAEYERCITYIAKQHGRDYVGAYRYTMPVHNGLSNGRKRTYNKARS